MGITPGCWIFCRSHQRVSARRARIGTRSIAEFMNFRGERSGPTWSQRTLPPLVVQSLALLVLIQPRPLHEFLPLHEERAVLHELVPLHELIPLHFTASSARAVDSVLAANNAAAEAARTVNLHISTPLTPTFPCRHQHAPR